jgi:hypothetical protein
MVEVLRERAASESRYTTLLREKQSMLGPGIRQGLDVLRELCAQPLDHEHGA